MNFLRTEDVENQVRKIIGEILGSKDQPLMTRSIHEIIWNYEDPLLKFLDEAIPELVLNYMVSIFNASVIRMRFLSFTCEHEYRSSEYTERSYQKETFRLFEND